MNNQMKNVSISIFIFLCTTAVAMESPLKKVKTVPELQEQFGVYFNIGECLIQAVCHQTPDQVKVLLDEGAPLDYEDMANRTALNHAVIKGRLEMLELLLAAGADVNHASYDAPTVLQDVISYRRIKMLPIIIAAGAEVRFFCGEESITTPLHYAAWFGNLTICSLLAEKMITLPDEDQKVRIYTFMNCMKKLYRVQYPNIRNFFKPVLQEMIKEENRDWPTSWVYYEIQNIQKDEEDSDDEDNTAENVKSYLLSRFPHFSERRR